MESKTPSAAPEPYAHPIDGELRKAVEDKAIPGVVAMATDREGAFYRGAFGVADADTARPMTADALFRIASMTKALTSVAALQLVETGRLRLDDAAERHLPAFSGLCVLEAFDSVTGDYRVRPAGKAVTVRHLMTHCSGLGYGFTSPVVRDFKPRAGEAFPVGPLMFEPGDQWLYGTSTDWLGRVIEAVSGVPLDDYFRRHILEPLAMPDTFYSVPADKQARLVATHRRQPDGTIAKDPNQPPPVFSPAMGGGGLSSTADDYIRFTRMLLNGGALDGERILSPETVELMSRNHIGALGVTALKSALPERSADFAFVADGRDKFGLGFLITADPVSGKRSAGSLSWGGISNTYFWIDRARGIAGVILMQFLPFADPQALAVYDAFERGVYRLADAM
ncbi:MAG TPA: serine hydrolase domain-containing protein [Xanthobacteraceae bacterium]|jgi:CubicO group peptidase (beta-lactamase class C family)